MDSETRIIQAYSQTPWRKQAQWIGGLLAGVVIVLSIASLFVSITAQTANTGKEIQRKRNQIEELEFRIADLKTDLATLTSATTMRQRALEMGFRPAEPDEITYFVVRGYQGREEVELGTSSEVRVEAEPVLSPAFTRSWVDLLRQQFKAPLGPLTDGQP